VETKAGYEKRRRRRRDWYKKILKKYKFGSPTRWRRRRKPAGRRVGTHLFFFSGASFMKREERASLSSFLFLEREERNGKMNQKKNQTFIY